MKTTLTFNTGLIILYMMIGSLTFVQSCSAQKNIGSNAKTSIEDLTQKTNATIRLVKDVGIAEFVKFPHNNPLEISGVSTYDKAISFLEEYKGIYDLKNVAESFIHKSTETDQYNLQRVTLEQVYNDVPVFDGKLIFHFNIEKKLTAINGNYIPNINLNAVPTIDHAQAGNIAVEIVNDQDINFSEVPLVVQESTLYVFQKGITRGYRGAIHLVYKIEVGNQKDVREFVLVDAHSGEIVEQYTGIAHAIDRVLYEEDTSNTVWEEGDPLPGDLTNPQQVLVTASEHTYNFFKNAFGFISYDNADAQMKLVNNTLGIECPNAFWNGVAANFCEQLAVDDIVGHEWGHAYTQFTSGSIYQWQSGAINEAYSDIWGETIDLLNNYEDDDEDLSLRTGCSSSDRWIQGEDAVDGGGRDMWNPNCLGDPSSVSDEEFWCLEDDNGGVHHNSGVVNHSYALLVDGGDYNGQTIASLGFTKTAHIYWRVLNQYLTETSGFFVFADALEAACTDLIGIDLEGLSTEGPVGLSGEVITEDDLAQVINVIAAVEFYTIPDPACFSMVLQPLEEELCDAATEGPIFFEDWEAGFGDWTIEQVPVFPDVWVPRDWMIFNGPEEVNRDGNIAYGSTQGFGNCDDNGQDGIIRLTSPVITMPNSASSTFEMAFNHAISFEQNQDGGNVKYRLNEGEWMLLPAEAFIENPYDAEFLVFTDNPIWIESCFNGGEGIGGNSGSFYWGTSVIDLSFIGLESNETIQFRFEIGTNGCFGDLGWGLDEIMVYNCVEPVSIVENSLTNTLKVYPNPTEGILNITASNQIKTLELINIYGQTITTKSGSSHIDLSGFSQGFYMLNVTDVYGNSSKIKVQKL
ncbi:MAG: bacillolysin [Flavobacteriales bacterium]|jgi:bacillolysin